jgi:hypothetical protein
VEFGVFAGFFSDLFITGLIPAHASTVLIIKIWSTDPGAIFPRACNHRPRLIVIFGLFGIPDHPQNFRLREPKAFLFGTRSRAGLLAIGIGICTSNILLGSELMVLLPLGTDTSIYRRRYYSVFHRTVIVFCRKIFATSNC